MGRNTRGCEFHKACDGSGQCSGRSDAVISTTLSRLLLAAAGVGEWREAGFGALDPRVVMRDTIPAAALMVGGMEIMLASFLLSVLTWDSDTRAANA